MIQFFAFSLTLAVCPVAAGDEPVVPGQQVPNLSDVRWIRGDPVRRFETGRIYVLEFWSTWCGACVDSIDELNELARRYEKDATFVSVHIWQQASAPRPVEFMEKRLIAGKAIMGFPVAEDSNGKVARAWMDATESNGLPTAMIIDRTSRLVWLGHARGLERPLKQVVDGNFDVASSLAEMKLRMRVGRLANESAEAIEKAEYDEGIRLILEAWEADPDTVATWIPSTYGHLLASSRSRVVAAGFARTVLATDPGKRTELLVGMAKVILHFPFKELRDLDLALTLAKSADANCHGCDAQIVSLVATLRAELGDLAGARQELERAIQNASNEDGRAILAKTLNELSTRSGE